MTPVRSSMSLSRQLRQVSPGNLHSGGTMGLNDYYLLYFKRDYLWDALPSLPAGIGY
jgi:hypothetical protein